jgi:hypothetical protein
MSAKARAIGASTPWYWGLMDRMGMRAEDMFSRHANLE